MEKAKEAEGGNRDIKKLKYYVANVENEDAADFPYVENWVWEALRNIYTDIDEPCTDCKTAEVKLALLRGDPISEIGFFGHGFQGWDGRIVECAHMSEGSA